MLSADALLEENPWSSLEPAPRRSRGRREPVRGTSRYPAVLTIEERLRTAPTLARWYIRTHLRIEPNDANYDQAYSDALLGIYIAARRHVPGLAAWSTFAVLCMKHVCGHTRITNGRKKRSGGTSLDLDSLVEAEDPGTRLRDVIPDGVRGPQGNVVAYRRYLTLLKLLATLTPREELILRRRFGFGVGHLDGIDHTLEEVALLAGGVHRERIRQIEAKALRKLRHPSRSRFLRAFVEGSDE